MHCSRIVEKSQRSKVVRGVKSSPLQLGRSAAKCGRAAQSRRYAPWQIGSEGVRPFALAAGNVR